MSTDFWTFALWCAVGISISYGCLLFFVYYSSSKKDPFRQERSRIRLLEELKKHKGEDE